MIVATSALNLADFLVSRAGVVVLGALLIHLIGVTLGAAIAAVASSGEASSIRALAELAGIGQVA